MKGSRVPDKRQGKSRNHMTWRNFGETKNTKTVHASRSHRILGANTSGSTSLQDYKNDFGSHLIFVMLREPRSFTLHKHR